MRGLLIVVGLLSLALSAPVEAQPATPIEVELVSDQPVFVHRVTSVQRQFYRLVGSNGLRADTDIGPPEPVRRFVRRGCRVPCRLTVDVPLLGVNRDPVFAGNLVLNRGQRVRVHYRSRRRMRWVGFTLGVLATGLFAGFFAWERQSPAPVALDEWQWGYLAGFASLLGVGIPAIVLATRGDRASLSLD